MDLANVLASHVVKAKYEDLSGQTVDIVKKLVLDTLGVAIAGSSTKASETVVDLVKGWGGKGESTLLVYGGKVPAPNAALANCTMARAWELDDVHEMGGGHLCATLVPVSLILAEYLGRPVSGRDFILAVTLGSDLACRLRTAMTEYRGWVAETFAPFGVAAAGGKLLGFDEKRVLNTMGIAYSFCSANAQATVDGALSVALQQGIGAKGGIMATMLAEKGFTGAQNVLEGVYGFYPLYARNNYDPKVILNQLGKLFEIVNSSMKPYASCKFTHIPIYAVVELTKKHSIDPRNIEKITVHTNSKGYNLCALGDNKYTPANPVEAQFSIPYTVAAAAFKKNFFIDELSYESIRNKEILELARRVKVEVDPELDKLPGILTPNTVELETKDGRHYSERIEFVKGHPKNPMSMAECVDKFRNCLRFSAKPLPKQNIAAVIKMVGKLEELSDVAEIVRLLAD